MKRFKTKYPGVYYILGQSLINGQPERIYYVNYRKSGKRIEEKAGRQFSDDMTASKANRIRALRIEGKQLSNLERRKRDAEIKLTKNIWTVDKLWNEFHYQKSEEGLKSLENDAYRFNKYLSPTFGKKEPKEITVREIDSYRIRLSKNLKPASVKHVLVLLKRIINFGFEKQLIPPLSFKIQMPKVDNLKTEMLSRNQLNKLLEVLNEDPNTNVANLMKLALFTGMRRGELFSLQWRDIDFEQGFIYIRNPKSGIGEKIPLNDSAREVLQSQFKTESPYVFPGQLGGKLIDIRRSVNRIKVKAQLPEDFRPLHGLRHVFASILASSGKVDMYVLQRLLTHKDFRMTQRYAHLRDDALKRASNLVGELISQSAAENQEKKVINIGDYKK